MWTVYMHTCTINDKKYIGITSQTPYSKRFNGDGSGYKTSVRFWNAIQKYGWDNFSHEVLAENIAENEAKDLERHYIELYQTQNDKFGYNIKEGGQGEALPQSVREKIRQSSFGKAGTMTGKHHAPETRKKISDAQKGRAFTDEHLANLREAHAKRRGEPTTHMPTVEEIQQLAERSRKKVQCVETGRVFDSMGEAAEWLGVLISNLSKAIKQQRKYKGYHFVICS